MKYNSLTQQEIRKLLGLDPNAKDNFKRLIERKAKIGIIITEKGRNEQHKKLYDIEIPDSLYPKCPKGYEVKAKEITLTELGDMLNYTYQSVKTSFPTMKKRQFEHFDRIIERYATTYGEIRYDVYEKPSPKNSDLPNEVWIDCALNSSYLISNQGRVKRHSDNALVYGNVNKKGYVVIIGNDKKPVFVHRAVMQSFNPRDDYEHLFVDHINGIRDDNRLENLRWVSPTKNNYYRDTNLTPIGEKMAQLVQKIGYEETVKLLDKALEQ